MYSEIIDHGAIWNTDKHLNISIAVLDFTATTEFGIVGVNINKYSNIDLSYIGTEFLVIDKSYLHITIISIIHM